MVDDVGRSGACNMAADERLLAESVRSGARFLRLYRWDPPTLSIGRNQAGIFEGVPVVRRPTGGQAVWHDQEVTYAIAAPIAEFGSLRKAYREIHARLTRALRALGVDAVLAPARPPLRPSARPSSCFATSVGGEILVNGAKLVGSAQVRSGDTFLQHGSILLAGTQEAAGSESGVTTLAGVLGRPVSFEEVASAIIAVWESYGPSVPFAPLRAGCPPVRPSDIASAASG
ncbi:MAG TPA: hypothetical protein VFO67_01505 [Gemmatimonadales bacterium]|nr:hypothetical protein [Gemmatimonadales bacterium]